MQNIIRPPTVVSGEAYSPGWKCNRISRKFPALAFLYGLLS